jgi:hypothetical protein
MIQECLNETKVFLAWHHTSVVHDLHGHLGAIR